MAKKNTGFTVVEVIVAIVILSLAIVSGFQLVGTFITTVANNRDKLTATYLGQECLENARNIRDTNWIKFEAWDEGLKDMETDNKIFEDKFEIKRSIVIDQDSIETITNAGEDPIKLEKQATITCTVSWNKDEAGDGGQELIMESVLTNWRKN